MLCVLYRALVLFFFFKQKTAYEMRISDWSSDVCSSDLGQGSLFHPAYAGVTLGLLHGSQPDAMVLCSDPSRTALGDFDLYPQPDLADCVTRYVDCARLTKIGRAHV